MIRIAITVLCAVSLSACADLPDWAAARQFLSGGFSQAGAAQYHFDWQLSGEQQVAPLQVFDDGKKTWLHFLPEQIVPAIFAHTEQGDRLLPYVRQGEYLILDGVWPLLRFRGGALNASAHKQSLETRPDSLGVTAPVADAAPGLVSDAGARPASDQTVSTMPVETDTPASPAIQPELTGMPGESDEAGRLTHASFDLLAQPSYGVRLQDGNLRQTLHRWARRANWTFAAEHWDVDVDIPISGEADFHGSFQEAVQDVLATTELADHPLRPCFYSNRVLRVVAYAQACDRSGAQTS